MFSECNPQKEKHVHSISSPPMENEMQTKGSGGRVVKIVATATRFEPARYNVNMYHAGNMLQTNASKHANRSKSYHAYTNIAFHSIRNEKQIVALYNHRTPLFKSLPETRCSVNAILKRKSMYIASHPPNGKLAVAKRKNPPRKKCKELQRSAQHGRFRNLKRKTGVRRLRMHLRMSKPKVTQM